MLPANVQSAVRLPAPVRTGDREWRRATREDSLNPVACVVLLAPMQPYPVPRRMGR